PIVIDMSTRPRTSTLFPYTTLFRSIQDESAVAAYLADTPAYLAGRNLTADERAALLGGDYATLFRLGVHPFLLWAFTRAVLPNGDRKSTRLNSSHVKISYAVFCLKK